VTHAFGLTSARQVVVAAAVRSLSKRSSGAWPASGRGEGQPFAMKNAFFRPAARRNRRMPANA
jgi:hypothetical protein